MTAHVDKYVGDWGHYSLPVRGKIGAATLEISVTVPHEAENRFVSRSCYTTLGYTPKDSRSHYTDPYSSLLLPLY